MNVFQEYHNFFDQIQLGKHLPTTDIPTRFYVHALRSPGSTPVLDLFARQNCHKIREERSRRHSRGERGRRRRGSGSGEGGEEIKMS
jgi:hypothetical protein